MSIITTVVATAHCYNRKSVAAIRCCVCKEKISTEHISITAVI